MGMSDSVIDQANGENPSDKPKEKRKGKHDKPKPWDEDPNIDRWKIHKFDPSWNKDGLLEVSAFSTLFPQYRGMLGLLHKQGSNFILLYFNCLLLSCVHHNV